MFRSKKEEILPTTHPTPTINIRTNLQPPPASTSPSALSSAAIYLSSTWQWLLGARWVYIVSLHDFGTYTPQHTIIGCFSTQAEADSARDRAVANRQGPGARRVWRRYEEIEDGSYGIKVEDRDARGCAVLAMVQRMKVQ